MKEEIETSKNDEISKKDLDEMLKGMTRVYGGAISATDFLFSKKMIDIVLLDSEGLVIIVDDKLALFFRKENGGFFYDGWETGKFSDKYWQDFKGTKI